MDEADARMSLRGGNGQLRPDRKLDAKVPLTKRKGTPFAKWQKVEAAVFENPSAVMDALTDCAFPSLGYRSWAEAAEEMLEDLDESRFSAAIRWFAHAVLDLQGRGELALQARPWEANFARAASRGGGEDRDIEVLLADWLLDEFWSLEWATDSNLARASHGWATLLAVARRIDVLLRAQNDLAVDAINLKISKVGGLSKARLMRDLCVALRIPMTIEDSWGGDITTAAIAHLAHSTPELNRFSSTDFNSYVTVKNASGAPQRVDGRMAAGSEPGLGIEPDFDTVGRRPTIAAIVKTRRK